MLHCLKKLCAWSAEAPGDVNKMLINLMKELKVALKGDAPAENGNYASCVMLSPSHTDV